MDNEVPSQEISFEKNFSCNVMAENIHSSCLVSNEISGFTALLVLDEDNGIISPYFDVETGSIQRQCLSFRQISVDSSFPIALHGFYHGTKTFVCVTASTDGPKYVLQTYEVLKSQRMGEHIELLPIQTFSIPFRPFDFAAVSMNDTNYIMMAGDDKKLHAYLVDPTGNFHRSPFRKTLEKHWETRLYKHTSGSLGIRMSIEEW